jgi:hypothetical protein
MMALAVWFPANDDFSFVYGPWPIVTVMLGYFVVIILDNTLVWHSNRSTLKHQAGSADGSTYGVEPKGSRHGESPEPGVSAEQSFESGRREEV